MEMTMRTPLEKKTLMKITFALALIASIPTIAIAKPVAHHQASACMGGCNAGVNLPLGTMQTNRNAWNYGMIHIKEGWLITPQSGWYNFAMSMMYFVGSYLPAALSGNPPASSSHVKSPHGTVTHTKTCQALDTCR